LVCYVSLKHRHAFIYPPPSYGDYSLHLKRQLKGPCLSLNTYYSLDDDYNDFGILAGEFPFNFDESATSFEYGDIHQTYVGDAMQALEVRNYIRHFKTHAYKRFPLCFTILDISNNSSPNYSLYHEEFFNLDFNNGGGCGPIAGFTIPSPSGLFDIPAPSTTWPINIINDGKSLGLETGLYMQGMSDFFFQMGYKTGEIESTTTTPLTSAFSPCICRSNTVGETYNDPVFLSNEGMIWNTDLIPEFPIDQENSFAPVGNPELPHNAAYYLCPNCPVWRTTMINRLRMLVMVSNPDRILFDVRHFPKEGCFCQNCRIKYRDCFCNGNQTCTENYLFPTTNPADYFLHGFIGAIDYDANVMQQRLQHDLMDKSLRDHFAAI
jgi:hypothetical protein